jgi:hypothetical protein
LIAGRIVVRQSRVRFHWPGIPPSLGKLLQKVPRRLFAQRWKNHPSEGNLMRMNLAKYCTIKVEKYMKRVPGRRRIKFYKIRFKED